MMTGRKRSAGRYCAAVERLLLVSRATGNLIDWQEFDARIMPELYPLDDSWRRRRAA